MQEGQAAISALQNELASKEGLMAAERSQQVWCCYVCCYQA
jgi:hypothetical protein